MKTTKKAFGKVQRLKCELDNLVHRQHPDWAECGKLFYGSTWTLRGDWL